MSKTTTYTHKVPQSVIDALEALPQVRNSRRQIWNDELDALLLKYWDSGVSHSEISRIIDICSETCRKRYRQLTAEK